MESPSPIKVAPEGENIPPLHRLIEAIAPEFAERWCTNALWSYADNYSEERDCNLDFVAYTLLPAATACIMAENNQIAQRIHEMIASCLKKIAEP